MAKDIDKTLYHYNIQIGRLILELWHMRNNKFLYFVMDVIQICVSLCAHKLDINNSTRRRKFNTSPLYRIGRLILTQEVEADLATHPNKYLSSCLDKSTAPTS